MKRYALVWLASPFLLLAGCNSVSVTENNAAPEVFTQNVGAPKLNPEPTLKLVREGAELSLGGTMDDVIRVFGTPKGSFPISDLPPGFGAPYSVKGWETAREGVGAILYQDKVYAVMRQLRRSTQEDFDQLVDTISKENSSVKPKIVQGSRVVYYFWETPEQRIMLSALSTKRDAWDITEVLGDDTILFELGISPPQATTDQPKVDALESAKR